MKKSEMNKAPIIIGFVLALIVGLSAFSSLRNASVRLAAAAVTDSTHRSIQAEATAPDNLADADAITASAAVDRDSLNDPDPETSAESKIEKPSAGRVIGSGEASFYGRQFAGRPTASGERFEPAALTAAHRTLPFGSRVRVTNAHNGRSVVVRINDRGPFIAGRLIDVSRGAAERLGMIHVGTAQVRLELLS